MSAFFVGTGHIDALLTAAKALKVWITLPDGEEVDTGHLGQDQLNRIGAELIGENAKSLVYRYGEDAPAELEVPDPASYVFTELPDIRDLPTSQRLAAAVVELASCLDYQSCEHDEWEASWSWRFLRQLVWRAASAVPPSGQSYWPYRVVVPHHCPLCGERLPQAREHACTR